VDFVEFSDGVAVETSQDYEDFLKFLGTKIELDGWTGYSGGLDTKSEIS
jgi:hypothetical protein